jgi:biotin carboxylase
MQGPAITIAKGLGLYTIALDGSDQAPCIGSACQFEKIDLKDKEGIEAFALSIQSTYDKLGIMTAGTDFSASVAWATERLGLPGIPYETALNASDKSRMRECFKRASLPSPDFITITADEICESIPLPFPLVIKPVDNMGGRGCQRLDNFDDFQKAAKNAIKFSRSGRAIVEEYMDGPEFSVDAIVYHSEITICGLADRHIYFPPYFIEMGHTIPTDIKNEQQKELIDTFCAGVRALGIADSKNIGAAKGDIKLTSKGPMIGEIAARLSGGYMSGWTYPYSSGVQPIRAAILAAMGEKPDLLSPTKSFTCAERAFISIPGTVKSIYLIPDSSRKDTKGQKHKANNKLKTDYIKKQKYVNDVFFRITEGAKVNFPENNVSKCGNIIASARNREGAINAAEKAARAIYIRLDCEDKATGIFLQETGAEEPCTFPPNAFRLTERQKAAFKNIPDIQMETIKKQINGGYELSLYPFPAFTESELKDYMGRSIEENLIAIRSLTGQALTTADVKDTDKIILGRSFWIAFIRGAYQGALYYIDNLTDCFLINSRKDKKAQR